MNKQTEICSSEGNSVASFVSFWITNPWSSCSAAITANGSKPAGEDLDYGDIDRIEAAVRASPRKRQESRG